MNPIRQIIEDSPESITIPQELRHKRIEVIIWPLEEADIDQKAATNDGWPAGLFERTAGAWQGEPLTREPQGDYEQPDHSQYRRVLSHTEPVHRGLGNSVKPDDDGGSSPSAPRPAML
ncbi:MAG: hypothetical protein R6X17_01675 [Candidatus Competibacteraceae bacterium]